jgi:IS5 family transposase
MANLASRGGVFDLGKRRQEATAMTGERFKAQDSGTFFGDFLYDRIVPEDHFLRQLEALIPWPRFTRRLVRLYRGKARQGRPPYDPAVILKMLLVAYLYNLSERQTEVVANDSLSIKWFLGLAVDEPAPDHSTLTKFKSRLIERGKLEAAQGLLAEIIALAQEQGIAFGSIQVMDSVHTAANVNTQKDRHRKDRDGQPPRDGDARWGAKGSRKVRNAQGKEFKQTQYFFGYKAHCSLNAETELITSLEVTPGNAYDGGLLRPLLEQDLAKEVPVGTVAADRGYDDGDNHALLQSKELHSAIHLNDYRTQKKDPNKQGWLELQASPEYQAGLSQRYKIEAKFGEGKQGHGLRRCRYLGLLRYGLQAILTAIVLNLKRMVKLLTGTNFKGRARLTA